MSNTNDTNNTNGFMHMGTTIQGHDVFLKIKDEQDGTTEQEQKVLQENMTKNKLSFFSISKATCSLAEYLWGAQHKYDKTQKIDSRQSVEDIIVKVLDTQVAATAQEILSELAKHPRGTLHGSATSMTSLQTYLSKLQESKKIVKASNNLFILNRPSWTVQELTLIANRVYPTACDIEVGRYDVYICLPKHTYVKALRIPHVNVHISLIMPTWLESIIGEVEVPAFTSASGGKEFFHDVKDNLGKLENVARAYREFNYQFSIVWKIKADGSVEIDDKGNW